MGLDFSHSEARWSYSGFGRFRTKLAAEAGIALHCMEGFNGSIAYNDTFPMMWVCGYIEGDLDKKPTIGLQPVIKWSAVKDDIAPLLDHSDCDGELTSEECLRVAPRLRELVAQWSDDDRDKINALLLAEGMEEAAGEEESLRFI